MEGCVSVLEGGVDVFRRSACVLGWGSAIMRVRCGNETIIIIKTNCKNFLLEVQQLEVVLTVAIKKICKYTIKRLLPQTTQ